MAYELAEIRTNSRFLELDGKPVAAVELVLITVKPGYRAVSVKKASENAHTLDTEKVPKIKVARVTMHLDALRSLMSDLLIVEKRLAAHHGIISEIFSADKTETPE
jgi:hypothetical protein